MKQKISIVVACYNVEKYIIKCIDSIKNQTYKNFEVFLIDDGSVDSTKKLIKHVIKDDDRFRYIYKQNGGVSSARNLGLSLATGIYICFVDSDDWIEKTYLEKLYNSIVKDNNDFSTCGIKRIYESKITCNKIDFLNVQTVKYPALWNKMCKTTLFKKYNIKFLEKIWYEDLAVGAEIFLISNKYACVDDYLYDYRQNNNSLVHTYDDRIFDIYKIVETIEQFAKDNKIYESKKDSLEFINIYHILIATVYRSSFNDKFSSRMIMDINNYVNNKYPNWYKNQYIKKSLSFPYRTFLYMLNKKHYKMIYVAMKIFKKFLYI